MTELNGIRLPAWYNGVGLHDTVGCYAATMNYNDARAHAEEIKNHGCAGPYKLFVSGGNKVERARAYVDSGILPIIRDWKSPSWGTNPANWVMPSDQIRMYADVGVQLFEICGNEVNIGCEWPSDALGVVDPEPYAKACQDMRDMENAMMPSDPAVLAKAAVDAFEVGLNHCGQVGNVYPLLTSCTPGGNVDHRRVYPAIVAELNKRGLMDDAKHIAIHCRPHNNPPDAQWSATNTVTFDENRWIRDQFPTGIYYWVTEHGYSLNDDQNHNYPKIDLNLHTEYNWELDLRMNTAHPKETGLHLAGTCHWFEAGWGAWGAWPKDALRDSIVPEMPAPSPLWIRMGDRVNELEFNRYDIPPVTDYAKGFDCSDYQGDINWDAVTNDFSFVFIRASAGLTADDKYVRNFDEAGDRGLLRGAYHYLRQELSGQALFFYNTCGARVPELGYYLDLEQAELTADKCKLALETVDTWTKQTTGIYTRASFFNKFGSPLWAQGRKLWVASPGQPTPVLPQAWSTWEFWQTGQGPVAGQTMDLDSYNGDEESLFDNYGPEEPPVEVDVKVFDMYGAEQDWAWVTETYGLVKILLTDIGYRVIELHEIEGPMAFTCTLLSEAGAPVAGQTVAYIWPDGESIEITNSNGVAEHSAGGGEGYAPPGPGPISWEVRGDDSDTISGLGWLYNTNHRHLQVVMQWNGESPPPPDDWEEDTTARLERIEQKIDQILLRLP